MNFLLDLFYMWRNDRAAILLAEYARLTIVQHESTSWVQRMVLDVKRRDLMTRYCRLMGQGRAR